MSQNHYEIVAFLTIILSVGAFAKSALGSTGVPYTVLLLILGTFLGLIPVHFSSVRVFYHFISLDPHLFMLIFLPILIFDSAFTANHQLFKRAFLQVLFMATLGFLAITGITAGLVMLIYPYKWTLTQAILYGAIVSATDPVTVVAFLKEMPAMEEIAVLIEGESLLNDGAAIILYNLLRDNLLYHSSSVMGTVFTICKVIFGGIGFGYIFGKILVYSLDHIDDDSSSEILLTISFPYLVYWLSERIGVSGVLALVVMGQILASNEACISANVGPFLHRFWETLSHIANTVLFLVVGMKVTQQLSNKWSLVFGDYQWLYIAVSYLIINVSRMFVFFISLPIINLVGPKLNMSSCGIIAWSGLRGAVGQALALALGNSKELHHGFGVHTMIHTSGMVLFTILINGTSIPYIVKLLGLQSNDFERNKNVNLLVAANMGERDFILSALKKDRYLADANWALVENYTKVTDVIGDHNESDLLMEGSDPEMDAIDIDAKSEKSVLTIFGSREQQNTELIEDYLAYITEDKIDVSPLLKLKLVTTQINELTFLAKKNKLFNAKVFQKARLQALDLQTKYLWAQFHQLAVSKDVVGIIINIINRIKNMDECILDISLFNKYLSQGFLNSIMMKISKRISRGRATSLPDHTSNFRRMMFHYISYRPYKYFHAVLATIHLLSYIFIILNPNDRELFQQRFELQLVSVISVLCCVYILEIVFNILGYGVRLWLKKIWSYVNVIVFIHSTATVIYVLGNHAKCDAPYEFSGKTLSGEAQKVCPMYHETKRYLYYTGLLVFMKLVKKLKGLISYLIIFRMDKNISLEYQVLQVYRDSLLYLFRNVTKLFNNFEQNAVDRMRMELTKAINEITYYLAKKEDKLPEIACKVKTELIIRSTLRELLTFNESVATKTIQLKNEIDEIKKNINKKLDALELSLNFHVPSSFDRILQISWLRNAPPMAEWFLEHSQKLFFKTNDLLHTINEPCAGIYVIVSGIVEVHTIDQSNDSNMRSTFSLSEGSRLSLNFTTKKRIWNSLSCPWSKKNQVVHSKFKPSSEDTVYYLGPGQMNGEKEILNDILWTTKAIARTPIHILNIPYNCIRDGWKKFDDIYQLRLRMWLMYSFDVAKTVLSNHPKFETLTIPQILLLLEKSCLLPTSAINATTGKITIVHDMVLIQGCVYDKRDNRQICGPFYINHADIVDLHTSLPFDHLVILLLGYEYDVPAVEQDDSYCAMASTKNYSFYTHGIKVEE
ncbi:hypothetical protein SNEBB_002867 [Seison nebaliae]|nr:hypothetical protein SNEBB_002867 [Seison nebaliae]